MSSKKNPVSYQAVKNDSPAMTLAPAPVASAAAPAKAVTASAVAAPAAVAGTALAAATIVRSAPAAAVAVPQNTPGSRDRSSIVALIGRLRDPDAETARDAAQTLATLPADAEAVDALCTVVRNADGYFHPVVRAAAAATLGRMGERRAVDSLIAGTRDGMAEASEESIKALGLLGDARAIPALETIVRNEAGFFLDSVRRTAEAAVTRIRSAPRA